MLRIRVRPPTTLSPTFLPGDLSRKSSKLQTGAKQLCGENKTELFLSGVLIASSFHCGDV